MAKRIVIISDTQMPFEHKKALKGVLRFIGEYQPDEVVHIGDIMDYPQPSRWNKDTKGEFEGSIYADSDYGKRHLLEPLRAVYDGPAKFLKGNHDERPEDYLKKYAPALAGTDALSVESLLDFDGFGIELLPTFYRFAPGWVMTHGHKGLLSLSRIAGNTALNAAKKFGVSVIMGHTHRLGVGSHSTGYEGQVNTLTGFEVGHLMDTRLASAQYLKGGTANWQAGFGLAEVDGSHVHVRPVAIVGRKFIVDGVTYQV
ncbi:Phage protein 54 [Amycolatopsis japonica]|uniref:Phage protein 54 n=1 Tax=Amycolatopsis japonica TaxID=208439 RepID=A0A075UZM1_9PSEU|nr:metallophosphoesterase [Amycolatopsis japonica]AIG78428.1 Phage protein 54 [Amycolatopsis japonica]